MSKLINLVGACAIFVLSAQSYAFRDLGPNAGSQGWGNIGGGSPSGFEWNHGFGIRWTDSPIPTTDQFVDVLGTVGASSVLADGRSPYVFTGVRLTSADGLKTYGMVNVDETSRIDFTFGQLAEGAYLMTFFGRSVPLGADQDFGWPVAEWSYSFRAIASPAPEASDLAMLAMGLAGVAAWSRRRARRAAA